MNPRDKFDGLEAECQFQSDLGAELLAFIDDKREPFEYLPLGEDEADDSEAIDLQSMGLVPFLTKGDEDDV